jgi:acyl-coenzyme A thioesterase PaaI-like protein
VASVPAAIQDQLGFANHCFGCGPDNAGGLQIKSHWLGDHAVCAYRPRPTFTAGTTDVLNGGIIATIVDCHSVCTAIAAAYAAEGRPLGSAPPIWCVTGQLELEYLRPTPVAAELTLDARALADDGRRITVACVLTADGKVRVRGRVVAVRVTAGSRIRT